MNNGTAGGGCAVEKKKTEGKGGTATYFEDFHSSGTFGISRLQRPPGSSLGSSLCDLGLEPARLVPRRTPQSKPCTRLTHVTSYVVKWAEQ